MNVLNKKVDVVKIVPASSKVAENGKSVANSEKTKNEELQEKKKELNSILSPPTADQRIKNAEIFTRLADKYQFLRKKKDHLTSFMASRDGLKEKLYIVSDSEENFEISNTRIIEKILTVCELELDELLQQSEIEVSTFSI